MKADGALDILHGFVKRVPLADNDSVDAEGIGHTSIGMFFNLISADGMAAKKRKRRKTKFF